MYERVEHVGDGDEPGPKRDRLALKAGWVAARIPAFMVRDRDLLGVAQ